MFNLTSKQENGTLTLFLAGRVDSGNAAEAEKQILAAAQGAASLTLDVEKLEYISSAGLRVILRLKKTFGDVKIVNASPEVYDIFDMTGFTEMMEIAKAYRKVSVEGCEVIGEGANGKVYRIDPDTIVKVYKNHDALEETHKERELARKAFVMGVPTAIPYDVVRIRGGGFGSVFELLNAESFASLLARGEKPLEELAAMSVELLKLIHSTVVKPDSMPDMKAVAMGWAEFLRDRLPAEAAEKLLALVDAVPADDHMLHGDFHVKNVMLQNGEALLIDMDTLCHGHPVFELASMFNAYRGFLEPDHSMAQRFLGISYEAAAAFWEKSLALYFPDAGEETRKDVENKASVLGYARIMRRSIRRGGQDTPEGRTVIEHCRSRLLELLPRVDTLLF